MKHDRRYRSSIPAAAREQVLETYPAGAKKRAQYLVRGRVVGERTFFDDGYLASELPLKDGRPHGPAYYWDPGGVLSFSEPYVNGRRHGTARQWAADGRLLGAYTLRGGTGLDLWRVERPDGSVYLSEVHSLRHDLPHGVEWWLAEDERRVWHERHWRLGRLHGIERLWNVQGRLRRGYPRYYVLGERVTRRLYLRTQARDRSLPPFRQRDNQPARRFPPEVRAALGRAPRARRGRD